MSYDQLQTIHKHNFKVCRFCLCANKDELSNLYNKILGDVIVINKTIRNVLTTLDIKVEPQDPYPKLICIKCRDMLNTINQFQKDFESSQKLLTEALSMQEHVEIKIENDLYTVENDASSTMDEVYEELVSEEVFDEASRDHTECTNQRNSIEPSAIMLSIDENYTTSIATEPEEESEEAYLRNGYIPVEDCDLEIIPKQKNRKPKQHVCPICGAQTTALAVHMRIHSNDRPFACDMCDLKFYTSGKLRCHRDSVHIAERKFSCDICGKTFVLKKNLKAHMMSHSNKRDHVCSYCSKSFLFRWSLVAHERTHTGERPFVCNFPKCGKNFVTVSNLIQHQKTVNHSKDTPLEVCSLCNKAFQTQAALKAHRTKRHGPGSMSENVLLK